MYWIFHSKALKRAFLFAGDFSTYALMPAGRDVHRGNSTLHRFISSKAFEGLRVSAAIERSNAISIEIERGCWTIYPNFICRIIFYEHGERKGFEGVDVRFLHSGNRIRMSRTLSHLLNGR